MSFTVIIFLVIGFLAFNSMPHLVKGITGQDHMTPFAQRSGPVVNVLWGNFNLIAAWVLWFFVKTEGTDLTEWVAFLIGGLIISIYLANFWKDPDAKLPWHK